MLLALALVLAGLLVGVAATQRFGLRLGGVLTVPLLAVYTLRDATTLPVFLASIVVAYVAVDHVTKNTLLHGRPLFLVGIVAGMAASVVFYGVAALAGAVVPVGAIELVGSVLPGIAAYNFHRQEGREMVVDAGASLATLAGLLGLGAGLVALVGGTPLATLSPPVLLAPTADVVGWMDVPAVAAAAGTTYALAPTLVLVVVGMTASEFARRRWGLRPGGIVALPVLALLALANAWMLPVYLIAAAAAYGATRLLARRTLIYGRVLLSAAIAVGVVVATFVALPAHLVSGLLGATVADGLAVFVVGVLGGVGAYNLEVVPAAERPHTVAVASGQFAGLAWLGVALFPVSQGGLLADPGMSAVVATALAAVAAGAAQFQLERAAFGLTLPDVASDYL
jgi:hypothetical protein